MIPRSLSDGIVVDRSCLTNDMYSGDALTLGKITSLVWSKLREGVVRC